MASAKERLAALKALKNEKLPGLVEAKKAANASLVQEIQEKEEVLQQVIDQIDEVKEALAPFQTEALKQKSDQLDSLLDSKEQELLSLLEVSQPPTPVTKPVDKVVAPPTTLSAEEFVKSLGEPIAPPSNGNGKPPNDGEGDWLVLEEETPLLELGIGNWVKLIDGDEDLSDNPDKWLAQLQADGIVAIPVEFWDGSKVVYSYKEGVGVYRKKVRVKG